MRAHGQQCGLELSAAPLAQWRMVCSIFLMKASGRLAAVLTAAPCHMTSREVRMPCQIGIYEDPNDSLDNWNALIYLEDDRAPRDLLRGVVPFLREFGTAHDMQDAGALSAWLTWYLIDSRVAPEQPLPRVRLSRQIQSQIDAFYRISPGLVEVYSIDELLDWRMIAAVEVPPRPAEVQTEAGCGSD